MENPLVQRKWDESCFLDTHKSIAKIIKYFPTDQMESKPFINSSIPLTALQWNFPLHSKVEQRTETKWSWKTAVYCSFPVNRD